MREPHGNALVIDPNLSGGQWEADTMTCAHCNAVTHVAPGQELGFCRGCMQHICDICGPKRKCRPFELWLDRMESKAGIVRRFLGWATDKIHLIG